MGSDPALGPRIVLCVCGGAPDGRWSDGAPVTAEHFVAAYERALRPATASPKAAALHLVTGARDYGAGKFTNFSAVGFRALDAQRLEIRLEQPNPRFPHHVASGPWLLLGLTFANEADYDKIQEDDTFDFIDLQDFAPEKQLTLLIKHGNGSSEQIMFNHTYNASQIEWFKAGSALNLIKLMEA